jgi:hypothetical protein
MSDNNPFRRGQDIEDIRVTDKSADPSPRGGTPRTYVSDSDSGSDSGSDSDTLQDGKGKGKVENNEGEHKGGSLFLRF